MAKGDSEIGTPEVFDSRDMIDRIDWLETTIAAEEDARGNDPDLAEYDDDDVEDMRKELVDLHAFAEDADGYCADWLYGETFIRDDYFEDYARELAIGDVPRDLPWPFRHIDWEAAAEELKQDYTSYEWQGVTYWAR